MPTRSTASTRWDMSHSRRWPSMSSMAKNSTSLSAMRRSSPKVRSSIWMRSCESARNHRRKAKAGLHGNSREYAMTTQREGNRRRTVRGET